MPKQSWGGKKKKKHAGGINQPDFRQHYKATILQSNQDSVVLVPKQTYRPMEQNREPRKKPRHLWLINLWQMRQEHKMGKKTVFSASIAGKPGQLHTTQWKEKTPSHQAQK